MVTDPVELLSSELTEVEGLGQIIMIVFVIVNKVLRGKGYHPLKEQFLKQEEFDISSIHTAKIEQIEGLLFFPPIKGVITEQYNPAIGHPFVDIAAPNNSTVSAVLDGTIISAGWNDETGFTVQIQHTNDLVSIYKHNTRLLKKAGERVSAGTPIALVGDEGSLSTGPHLHFELWHKGEPVDPTMYINF